MLVRLYEDVDGGGGAACWRASSKHEPGAKARRRMIRETVVAATSAHCIELLSPATRADTPCFLLAAQLISQTLSEALQAGQHWFHEPHRARR